MEFNSGNSTMAKIELILGTKDNHCTGTAWFDQIIIEEQTPVISTTWEFLVLVFPNTNISLNGNRYQSKMTGADIEDIRDLLSRTKNSLENLSNNRMRANMDIKIIDNPISSLTTYKDNWWVSPKDISTIIDHYLSIKEYDHVISVVTLNGRGSTNPVPNISWEGLGGINHGDVGYSVINKPANDSLNGNTSLSFRERTFIHEFLHTLERDGLSSGYNIPDLHDRESFGYTNVDNYRSWYKDYMTENIYDNTINRRIGIPKEMYNINREFSEYKIMSMCMKSDITNHVHEEVIIEEENNNVITPSRINYAGLGIIPVFSILGGVFYNLELKKKKN